MSENNRNIDDLFRQELGNATEAPPSSVWEMLEQRLEQTGPANRSIRHPYRWGMLIVVVAALIAAYLLLRHKGGQGNPAATTGQTLTLTPEAPHAERPDQSKEESPAAVPVLQPGNTHQSLAAENETSGPPEAAKSAGSAVAASSRHTGTGKNAGRVPAPQQAGPPGQKPVQNSETKQSTTGGETGLKLPDQERQTLSETPQMPAEAQLPEEQPQQAGKKEGQQTASRENPGGQKTGSTTAPLRKTKEAKSNNWQPGMGQSREIAGHSDRTTRRKSPAQGLPKKAALTGKGHVPTAVKPTPGNALPVTKGDSPQPAGKNTTGMPPATAKTKHTGKSDAGSGITTQETRTDNAGMPVVSASEKFSTAHGAKAIPAAGHRNEGAFTQTETIPPGSRLQKKTAPSVKPTAPVLSSAPRDPKAMRLPEAETAIKPIPQSSEQQERAGQKQEIKEKAPAPVKPAEKQETSPAATENKPGQAGGSDNPPSAMGRKTRRPLNMSVGVKAAYENGFQTYRANTFIASIFGEVNFSPKVSFIIQPGIRLANTSSQYRTANGTYIRAGDVKSTMYYEERDSANFPTGFKNYAYSQAYDSIVAYRQAQKQFTEIELPFILRYKMDKNLSFLAGMNFTFGKTLKMEGVLQSYSGLPLADSVFHYYDTAGITPPTPAIFSHSGSVPFSAYKDPAATELINLIRFGYTIGLSYTARQRLIVDLTLQQNLSRLSDIDDKQIKKLFTQPYVRLSVGYSILGRRK